MNPLLARDPDPLLATCARCHETADVTIEDALRTGWCVIDSELTCPDHVTHCTDCTTLVLLDRDECVSAGRFHCAEHSDCSECGRYESRERERDDY